MAINYQKYDGAVKRIQNAARWLDTACDPPHGDLVSASSLNIVRQRVDDLNAAMADLAAMHKVRYPSMYRTQPVV